MVPDCDTLFFVQVTEDDTIVFTAPVVVPREEAVPLTLAKEGDTLPLSVCAVEVDE